MKKKKDLSCIVFYRKTGEYCFLLKKGKKIFIHKLGSDKIKVIDITILKKLFKRVELEGDRVLKFAIYSESFLLNTAICHNPPYLIYKIEKTKTEKNCINCSYFSLCICYLKII